MRAEKLLGLVPVFAVLFAGCGSGTVEEGGAKGEAAERRASPPPIDISLADLLNAPRADLAARAEETADRVRLQAKAQEDGRQARAFLPDLHLPIVVPVLREARYSAEKSASLPPYYTGGPDNELALHLARHGDVEAARRLADPADKDVLTRIDACQGERNYPLEWARLVGLLMDVAQLRLACGEPEGAYEMMALHQQLREVLDARAAGGPLGAVLLARGHGVLSAARAPLRAAGQDELAAKVDEALAAWGPLLPAPVAVPLGAEKARLVRLLGGDADGRVVAAKAPLRALDLLCVPLPTEGVQSAFACLDRDGRLTEIVVLYRRGIAHTFPEPRHLAYLLEEHGAGGKDAKGPGLVRRTYGIAKMTCEVGIVARADALGAFVRLADAQAAPAAGPLPRDFGALNLDRGFEQNRLRVAPEQIGERVQTERAAALADVTSPVRGVPLTRAVVFREDRHDVTARLLLRHAGDAARAPLHQTALGLWAAGGPARFLSQEDDGGGHLAVVWEDGETRAALKLPYADGSVMELEIEDVRDEKALPRRAEAAKALDLAERKARLAAGKPLTRLPRFLDAEAIRLGATRAQIEAALPEGGNAVRQTLADGVAVVVMGEAPKNVPYLARHLFVRFGADGRAVEVRARYADAAGGPTWTQGLLTGLLKRAGAAAEGPSPWTRLWPDLPPRPPQPRLTRWQDDLTVLVCQRDAWGVELMLRDASGESGAPAALPPLEYLSHGIGPVALGAAREDVLKLAGDRPELLADGALVVPARVPGYDSLLVWFDEEERVTRLVARHAEPGPDKAKPAQMAQRLNEAWAERASQLGWPRRHDAGADQALQSLGWHDDRTRMRLFWQPARGGPPRVYTEWRGVK